MKEQITYTLYYVKINWYNTCAEYCDGEPVGKDIDSKFFAFAPSLSNLAERIEKQFEYINSIKIEEVNSICSEQFFWIDSDEITDDMIQKFRDANDW